MSKNLLALPADQLLRKFGSGGHKPGSGSAAALLGLVSCKLIQTVVSLSSGRDRYRDVQAQLTLANQDIVGGLEPVLVGAVQEDAEQFDRVIKARRLRDEESDKNKKRALSDRALAELREATEIPIRICEACLQLAEKAFVVFDLGFKSARGDAGVAISSALAGAAGAISIIYLNLTSFKGGEWATRTRRRADDLSQHTQALQVQLVNRIGRLQQEVLAKEGQDGKR